MKRDVTRNPAKKAVDFNLPTPPKVPRRIVPVAAGLTPPKVPRAQYPFWCGGEDWEAAIGLGETINTNSTWSSLEEDVVGDGPAVTFAEVRARLADQLHPFVEDDDSSILSVDSFGNPLPPLPLLPDEEHPRGRAKPGARPPPGYQPPPSWSGQAPMSRRERAYANIREDLARNRRIALQRLDGTHLILTFVVLFQIV